MKSELKIYNTLSGQKELFLPTNPPFIGMYVCGPTVYNYLHLGNCRTFISFDLIYRYLLHLGYKVRYVRNITDAGHLENDADSGEDKISKKARLEQLEPMEIVQKYTLNFHSILNQFNTLTPNIEPTATGHILEQIEMIKILMKKRYAYEVNGSVYFDVETYNKKNNNSYGHLSGQKTEDIIEGTRNLYGQEEKKNSIDFALWKKASENHIMRWKSPWSIGFPGWHLECSVMSSKYLGKTFDIHGGGMDLKFPHHECEIAQSKVAHNKNPVKYWIHTNMLTLNGTRMSKSTGNTLLPEELFSGNNNILKQAFSPNVVRFFMMQAHYRNQLDFSTEALQSAKKGLMRLFKAWNNLKLLSISDFTSNFDFKTWKSNCYTALNDDFNTPILISYLYEAVKFIKQVQLKKETISLDDKNKLSEAMNDFMFEILGLQEEQNQKNNDTELLNGLMQTIIHIRTNAKQKKDYATSDKIREDLENLNIKIKDTKDDTKWEF